MESPDGLAVLAVVLFVIFALRKLARPGRGRYRGPRRRSAPSPPPPGTLGELAAQVLNVVDGDTVEVRAQGRDFRVRLAFIDCPENGQAWGNAAAAGLVKLIGGKPVVLEAHGVDDYGRLLATIFVKHHDEPGMINVNERMVMLGHAWVYRHYYRELPEARRRQLDRLESWARSKKVGLWRQGDAIPPWKWRRL
jgi:endonuclease YncB( thermonuclease family)